MIAQTTRTVITSSTNSEGDFTRAVEDVPANGGMHRVIPPELAGHEAAATWHDHGALVQELEPLIGVFPSVR